MTMTWDPLPPWERRILGVLVEKQKTSKTADAYPLTLNSLTLGCNQKSNRDPLMELSDDDVEETLPKLQERGLVAKVTGTRADRYRHLLYETWNVNAAEMAVLAELLLRGPQSIGDLRGRADRMSSIPGLDELKAILKPLAERKLVVFLTDPDRRGAMLTHGFHTPEELAGAVSHAGAMPVMESAPTRTSALESRLDTMQAEIDELKRVVAELKSR
ncbi:YceH family protein [soil metagenome]